MYINYFSIWKKRNTRWIQKTAPSWTELCRNVQNTHTHTHIYHKHLCALWAIPIHIWCHNFPPISDNLLPPLHNNSQAATLLLPTYTSKPQVSFSTQCHVNVGLVLFFFFFLVFYLFIYFFIYHCVESSFLCEGFL